MKELKNTKTEDLVRSIEEKIEAHRLFRFGIAGSKIRNVKEGKGLRKQIAQAHTELRKRRDAVK